MRAILEKGKIYIYFFYIGGTKIWPREGHYIYLDWLCWTDLVLELICCFQGFRALCINRKKKVCVNIWNCVNIKIHWQYRGIRSPFYKWLSMTQVYLQSCCIRSSTRNLPLTACCWRKLISSTRIMCRTLAQWRFDYHSICKYMQT